jgi:hypothetical protein
MSFGDYPRYDRDHGEGFISARGAQEKEQEKNWYKQLDEDTLVTLKEHMKEPFDAKFIWSSFLSLGTKEQRYVPDNIKHNAMLFNNMYPNMIPPPEFIQPTTYRQWRQKYPYAKSCPPGWSFFRQLFLGEIETSRDKLSHSYRSRSRSRSRIRSRIRDIDNIENTRSGSGGSRRSLQKSRLVKRKSRKYKSIKKSKKRSFRKRSGKY